MNLNCVLYCIVCYFDLFGIRSHEANQSSVCPISGFVVLIFIVIVIIIVIARLV